MVYSDSQTDKDGAFLGIPLLFFYFKLPASQPRLALSFILGTLPVP
jgi:hypothetical protein